MIKSLVKEPVVLKLDYHNYSQIVLNTPKQLNSLFHNHVHIIHNSLKICEGNENTKFIVFKSSLPGIAFCSGGDIKNIAHAARGGTSNNLGAFSVMLYELYQMCFFMATVKKPIVCYMDGLAIGGGCSLSQLLAFKIATENTILSVPECKIGHFCDASNSFSLSRLEGYLGTYLALTGDQIKAEDVLFAGLATHFVLSANLEAMERKISQLKNINLSTIDKTIQEFSVKMDHKPAHYTLYGEKLEIIERCFKFDTVEEIMMSLKKESSPFAQKCLKSMSFISPTSMKVTLAVIRYAKNRSMAECLNYEYRAWYTLPRAHDYQEGVEAVSNKRRPQWKPAKLEDVQDFKSDYLSPVEITPAYRLDLDYKIRPFKQYLLPTYQDIQLMELEHYGLNSHSQIVDWFVNDSNQKYGVKEKVKDVLKRKNGQKFGKLVTYNQKYANNNNVEFQLSKF